MPDDGSDRRTGDRRIGQTGYEGPERRVADRRMPGRPPTNDPSPSTLSDIDLLRAYQRHDGRPDDPSIEGLRAELDARGLGRS